MPTILHRLARWAEETPNAPAHCYKKAKTWHTITASQVCDRVYALGLYFESKGIGAPDVGAILSYNSPEWIQTELALTLVGAKSAGLYPNSTVKDIQYVLKQTGCKVLAVQNAEYFAKLTDENGQGGLPATTKVLLCLQGDTKFHPNAVSFGHALEEGMKLARESAGGAKHGFVKQMREHFLKKIDPKSGAFLIYTSGTTGNPKGVLLSHDNVAFTSDLVVKELRPKFADGSTFSFLPLCHVAEKMQGIGVAITVRYTVNFATRFENAAGELAEVQPTILLSVPRLWEKMMEGVQAKIEAGGNSPKARLARWALGVGKRVSDARYRGRSPSPVDIALWPVAQALVISKIRAALGLSRASLVASGAAALPGHVARWFRSIGVDLLEIFGQSETSAIICMTQPFVESSGTVGKPVSGIDFKIADDGEIMTRGRHVFLEYFNDPAATRETLVDGWLHTGDLGVINERGQLQIRGRKKEILKTSGGKMIAPSPLEDRIKAASTSIAQVCIVGDNRKYLSALITLSENSLAQARGAQGAIKEGSDGLPVVQHEETLGTIRQAIDTVNGELASFEQIKKFTVIGRDFSIADGEMTPTLKMKRNVIETRFRPLIDAMY